MGPPRGPVPRPQGEGADGGKLTCPNLSRLHSRARIELHRRLAVRRGYPCGDRKRPPGWLLPECDADDRPWQTQAALREWGLPYASDSAVTRHLANFLKDRPPVEAVLFNGGSLYPPILRQRICEQIGKWQGGLLPIVLKTENPTSPWLGAPLASGKSSIIGLSAFNPALPVRCFWKRAKASNQAGETAGPSLVCVLPRGAAAEQTFEIADLALELRVNRPVRFQTYYSTRHGRSKAGDILVEPA